MAAVKLPNLNANHLSVGPDKTKVASERLLFKVKLAVNPVTKVLSPVDLDCAIVKVVAPKAKASDNNNFLFIVNLF